MKQKKTRPNYFTVCSMIVAMIAIVAMNACSSRQRGGDITPSDSTAAQPDGPAPEAPQPVPVNEGDPTRPGGVHSEPSVLLGWAMAHSWCLVREDAKAKIVFKENLTASLEVESLTGASPTAPIEFLLQLRGESAFDVIDENQKVLIENAFEKKGKNKLSSSVLGGAPAVFTPCAPEGREPVQPAPEPAPEPAPAPAPVGLDTAFEKLFAKTQWCSRDQLVEIRLSILEKGTLKETTTFLKTAAAHERKLKYEVESDQSIAVDLSEIGFESAAIKKVSDTELLYTMDDGILKLTPCGQ